VRLGQEILIKREISTGVNDQ